MLEPAEGAGGEVGVDLFDLGVGVVAVGAEFASDAALPVAAPGGFVEGRVVVVDPGDAGAQFANHALGARAVAGEDGAGQAVDGVVGELDGLGLGVENLHGEHGAEDFLLHDAHAGRGAGEDGGLDEISRRARRVVAARAAAEQRRALGFPGLDVAEHLCLVRPGNERTHLGLGIGAGADDDLAAGDREPGQQRFRELSLDEEARPGAAHLALAGEDPKHRELERHVGVGVGKHDVWAFAAEFECDLFQVPRGRDHDLAPGHAAAGEGDFIDVLVRGQRGADGIARAEDEAGGAGREASLVDEFEEEFRAPRREFRGFQNAAVAGGEAGRELPRRHQEREIPRNDLAAHADRLAHGLADDVRIADLEGLAVRLGRQPRVVAETPGGVGHVVARLAQRLAII